MSTVGVKNIFKYFFPFPAHFTREAKDNQGNLENSLSNHPYSGLIKDIFIHQMTSRNRIIINPVTAAENEQPHFLGSQGGKIDIDDNKPNFQENSSGRTIFLCTFLPYLNINDDNCNKGW